jgi:hypothetical protein
MGKPSAVPRPTIPPLYSGLGSQKAALFLGLTLSRVHPATQVVTTTQSHRAVPQRCIPVKRRELRLDEAVGVSLVALLYHPGNVTLSSGYP